MSRFCEVDQSAKDIMKQLIDSNKFLHLRLANIKIVMDSKIKIDKLTETITFAYIKLANEVEKFLVSSNSEENLDYIMFISSYIWEMASEEDKKRIISHELRHTYVDEKGNYKLIKHEIEDFFTEIKLNEDKPNWKQDLATLALAKIEEEKEGIVLPAFQKKALTS